MALSNTFQSIFRFNTNDLIANRGGQLSDDQILKLKHDARMSSILSFVLFGLVLVFITLALAGIGSAVFSKPDELQDISFSSIILPLIAPIIFWIIFAYLTLRAIFSMISPKTPTLSHMTGLIVQGNRTSRSGSSYEIEMNGQSLTIPSEAYQLIDPAKIYTIYKAVYSPNDTGTIVGIEEGGASSEVRAASEKTPLQYEKETLQRIFNFTDADLKMNEAGQLSPEQQARLNKNVGSGVGCGIFFGVIFGIFPLVFISGFTQNVLLAVGVTAVVFLLCLYASINNARQQHRKLAENGGVTKISGVAKVWITTVHHSGKNAHTETIHHVQFGDTELRVSQEIYFAFKEGKSYNVYQALALDDKPIVSAEQLG